MIYTATSDGIDISNPDIWPWSKNFTSLADLVSFLLPKALLLGGVIFFILIIIGGIGMIAGAGGADAHAAENRKKALTYSVAGFIIMLGAYWILQIINYITGGALKDILGP